MGLRAYLLVNMQDECKGEAFQEAVADLEKMVEVDYADPVVGDADVVVMIEADNIEIAANRVEALACVESVSILKIVSVFERHRSSKQDLLKKLSK
ncbi:MAG: hypothetical protein NUK65_02910 [Firmicutes bacterium]|nr:hypothetical protein [Bacillota bacterium]